MMDPKSETWLSLRKTINERIEKLRDDLEIIGIDPGPLRGEITGLRWVKKMVEPDAPITEATSTDYNATGAHDPS